MGKVKFLAVLVSGILLSVGNLFAESRDVKSLIRRADRGDSQAQYELACYYAEEEQNQELFEKYIILAAENGNIDACLMWSDICFQYKDDLNEAEKYVKIAADKGNLLAMVRYGLLKYVKKEYKEAFNAFKLAEEKGDASANIMLIKMYLSGVGCEKNEKLAFEHAKKAVAAELPDGYNEMANFYRYGIVVKQDMSKAIELLEIASSNGISEATYDLGLIYLDDIKDEKKAFQMFQKAHEMGNANAAYMLGLCYDQGLGVAEDLQKAFDYYKLAADAGVPPALFNLACFYATGELVEKNEELAFNLAKQAADGGFVDAMYVTFRNLVDGFGCEVDYQESHKYLQMAADHGHPTALKIIEKLKQQKSEKNR